MMMQVPAAAIPDTLKLRSLMSAGESVGGELLRWGQERLQLTINEMWGQTEVNYLVGNCAEVLPVKPGSISKSYPGHHIDAIDETGQPSAGYRIGPTEIEECLLKHPAVAQAAVIGIPDALRGSIIKAFIIPAAGITPSSVLIDEIQAHVRARLAAYEYPREIEFLTELPLTTTGKIRRVELRRREAERRLPMNKEQ